jgi:hypothetical protein
MIDNTSDKIPRVIGETKLSNPKDAIGCTKVPLSYVPLQVLMEMALGMLDGGCKYGRHNYREVGVRASIYLDATIRHLVAWFEGEDNDPDSAVSLSHITKAMTSLCVLRDSMLIGNWVDDRPPASGMNMSEFSEKAKKILAAYPNPVPPFTEVMKRREGARSFGMVPAIGASFSPVPVEPLRVYLSHCIRGKEGADATEESMRRNCDAAKAYAAQLRQAVPGLDLYVPAEHETFVHLAFERALLTEQEILAVDCAIIDGCDAVVFYNQDGYLSPGMKIEEEHSGRPVVGTGSIKRLYTYHDDGRARTGCDTVEYLLSSVITKRKDS